MAWLRSTRPADPVTRKPLRDLAMLDRRLAVLTRYDAVLFAGPVLLAAIVEPPFRYARLMAMAVAALPALAGSSMRAAVRLNAADVFLRKTPTAPSMSLRSTFGTWPSIW